MATQEHSRPQRREGEPEPEPDAPVAPEASARKEALDDDIDTATAEQCPGGLADVSVDFDAAVVDGFVGAELA